MATGNAAGAARLDKKQQLQRDHLASLVDKAINLAPRRISYFDKVVRELERSEEVDLVIAVDRVKVEERSYIMEALDAAIQLEALAPGTRPSAQDDIQGHFDEFEAVAMRALQAESAARRAASNQAAAGGGNAGDGGAASNAGTSKRVASVLKPEKLEGDATISEFKDWRRKWEDYYLASKMADLDIAEQEAYLHNCLSGQVIQTL